MPLQKKSKNKIAPGIVIRNRRESLGWRAVDLARRANINPRTLDAIEKGRIESPSISSLEAISKALGVSTASLFAVPHELEIFFVGGNQKGQHLLEFPNHGFRIVCYIPFVPSFFVGKVILKGGTRIDHKVLPTKGMIFVQAIMGKVCVNFEDKENLIKEGNYAFFDGSFPHTFYNPQYKEITFLLITAPSFLSSNQRS